MRLIFAGTPEFAAIALRQVADAGHVICLVLTQPDRPSGRGMAVQASPVKRVAQSLSAPVFQPVSLKDETAQEIVRAATADVMLVAAYGLILPQAVLDMPRFGCLNIHASLLPRWRGAAPIQRALLAGDEETGVCLMQMEAGLDTGPVLARRSLRIGDDETAGSLHDRLAVMGARLAVDVLERLPCLACPQSAEGVTYAAKLDKQEARLDWRLSALELDRRVRAFNPFPGALTSLAGQPIKIWRAQPVSSAAGEPGSILSADKSAVVVACGSGALSISELQKAGGKRLSAAQFIAGHVLGVGEAFDV